MKTVNTVAVCAKNINESTGEHNSWLTGGRKLAANARGVA